MEKDLLEFHDENFEIDRPHESGRLYNFLIDYKLRKPLDFLPFNIKNLSLLDICCGSGMVSEFYAKKGANVYGSDISKSCIKRARKRAEKYMFKAKFCIADSENLPFPSNSYDLVLVHDGLHHLDNPSRAIIEMVRVAKKGIIIIEPADALITKISILIGVSKRYEDVGNFVYRFKNSEIINLLYKAGCRRVMLKRYIMWYPHKPNKFFNIFSSTLLFSVTKILFYLMNLFIGKFGNKLQVVGLK